MLETNGKITYGGRDYILVFNLNVMEEIQNEYGSIAKWGELTDNQEEPDAKAVKFGYMCMLNEGIDIENEKNHTDTPYLSAKQVGRMLTEIGLNQASQVLNQTVIDSTKTDEKNV